MCLWRSASFITLFAALSFPGSLESAEPTQRDDAIRRAVPYLQREGVAWMDRRGCVSCHQIPFMLWSLSAAEQQGFDVDPDKLKQWRDWSVDATNFVKPAKKKDVDVAEAMAANIDTMNALLLAIEDDGATWRSNFAQALVDNQNEDGSWKACGQLPAQKRPAKETTNVTVLWTMLSLKNQGRAPKDPDSAQKQIDQFSQAESAEWLVARLLLARASNDSQTAQSCLEDLRGRQHEDGGWGWVSQDPSDALATGMALYAISKTGNDDDNESVSSAVKFLVGSQKEDGSWAVPGTKKATRKKPTPTSNYWGTAWAVIGLLEAQATE